MTDRHPAARLAVGPLEVQGDSVTFRWVQTGGGEIFRKTEFSVRYPGQDLTQLPERVFWSMFCCLVIPLYGHSCDSVDVEFPEQVPRQALNTWASYNSLGNVRAGPQSEEELPPAPRAEDEKVGVLFGGGKDSLFALGVLTELYGPERVVLLSCVFPTQRRNLRRVEQRRDALALDPIAGEAGVAVQKIITDLRANICKGTASRLLHSSLYHGLYAPLVPLLNLGLVTHSNEFNHYWTSRPKKGAHFNYRRSRPEYDDFVAKRMSRLLGQRFKIKNLNFCISKEASIAVLVARYPHLLKYIMMCEATAEPRQRWCGRCYKCFQFAVYALCFGLKPQDLDLDWFFADSPFMNKATASIEAARAEDDRPHWMPAISSRASYPSFCHLMATVDLEQVRVRLGDRAYANFLLLRDQFPPVREPLLESYMVRAVDRLAPPKRKAFEKILGAVLVPAHDPTVNITWGPFRVQIDYSASAEIPRRKVPGLVECGRSDMRPQITPGS